MPRLLSAAWVCCALLGLSSAASARPAIGLAAAASPSTAPAEHRGILRVGVSLAGRVHAARYDAFPVDTTGQESPGRLELGSRLLLRTTIDVKNARRTLEARLRAGTEIAHGTFYGGHDIAGDQLPPIGFSNLLPIELYAALRLGDRAGLEVGQMTSNWSLGLLANDGLGFTDERAADWFSLPRVGDRVNRALLWARPWSGGTSALRGLALFAALDRVVQDDIQDEIPGAVPWLAAPNRDQKAEQLTLAARMYLHEKRWIGLYYVHRWQEHADGKRLRADVLDLAADLDFRDGAGAGLRVQAEGVGLLGRTTLGPTPDFPEHDITQYALAARARWTAGRLRAELDAGLFSGDASTDDGTVTNFKADPNYQQGLILFRRLLAWQSGRARLTASNLDVVGRPNEDLDRLATGGSVTNALTFFPKLGYSPLPGVQVYGGVLFALAMADPVDPFHSRTLGGGEPRNYLGARPGGPLLGTELDAGVAWRVELFGVSALWLRAEYGVLLPGAALQGEQDELGTITGGRISIATGPGRTGAGR